jgi:Oxidoreductase family, NAD-binding Rossmann fold
MHIFYTLIADFQIGNPGLYLPAIARWEGVELVALVDKSLSRARQLMAQCSTEPAVFDDYRQIFGKADAAVVALPNALHAATAIDLLEHGMHVLVEKPMALNSRECEAMTAASIRNDRVLAVGMVRRFGESSKFVKEAVQGQLLGEIKHFDLREGRIFDWQIASDSMFRKDMAGGGCAHGHWSTRPRSVDLAVRRLRIGELLRRFRRRLGNGLRDPLTVPQWCNGSCRAEPQPELEKQLGDRRGTRDAYCRSRLRY